MTSERLDDLSLVRLCKAGESEAFGELVRRHQERLFPTVHRIVGSVEDAEDALQDAFVRAFQKLATFHGESSFYTWVYRIAVNVAMETCRRRKVRRLFMLALEMRGGSRGPDPASEPPRLLDRRERERAVEAALDRLGPEHRAIVVLKDFDGRRYEEIAELLGVPVGTVRSRLHRARRELREHLRGLLDVDLPLPEGSAASTT